MSDWYFRDWNESKRIDPITGKHKRVYTYVGAWYRLPLQRKKWLRLHIGLFVLFLAGLCWLIFRPSSGGMTRQVGPLCILAVAPAIFWGIGLGNMCLREERMTYRDYFQSFRRSRWSSIAAGAVMALTTVFELIYIVKHGLDGELSFLLVLLLTLVCSGTAAVHHVRRPCKNLGTQKPE